MTPAGPRIHRSTLVLVVLLAVLLVGALLWVGGPAPQAHELTRAFGPAWVYVARAEVGDRGTTDHASVGVPSPQKRDPAARDALRRDIVRGLEHRAVPTAPKGESGTDRSGAPNDREARPPSGSMRDYVGGHDALLARLNEDFMPLADECMDQARERLPDLSGLVAIEVELLAERDIGAIVETAEPAPENDIDDPELVECLQQTLLSMALPGDAVDGRERFMISLRAEPE